MLQQMRDIGFRAGEITAPPAFSYICDRLMRSGNVLAPALWSPARNPIFAASAEASAISHRAG